MGLKYSSIVKAGDDSDKIIFDYVPKIFSLEATQQAKDYSHNLELVSSDFKISDLVSEQVGISQLQRNRIDEKIQQETLKKLSEIEEKAYKEAYDLGLIDGTAKAFQEKSDELTSRIKQLDNLIRSFEVITQNVFDQREAEIMSLIFQIASKIAMFEVKQNKKMVVDLIDHLVQEVQSDEKMLIKISKEDAQFIEESRQQLEMAHENLARVKIEAVEGMTSGGCVLETNYGMIEATIEQRVKKAWAVIAEKLPYIPEEQTMLIDESAFTDQQESNHPAEAISNADFSIEELRKQMSQNVNKEESIEPSKEPTIEAQVQSDETSPTREDGQNLKVEEELKLAEPDHEVLGEDQHDSISSDSLKLEPAGEPKTHQPPQLKVVQKNEFKKESQPNQQEGSIESKDSNEEDDESISD